MTRQMKECGMGACANKVVRSGGMGEREWRWFGHIEIMQRINL